MKGPEYLSKILTNADYLSFDSGARERAEEAATALDELIELKIAQGAPNGMIREINGLARQIRAEVALARQGQEEIVRLN